MSLEKHVLHNSYCKKSIHPDSCMRAIFQLIQALHPLLLVSELYNSKQKVRRQGPRIPTSQDPDANNASLL